MQLKYTDIDIFANDLKPWMQGVFHHVRMLLLTFPEITEKIRFNTPFYDCGGKMMLYLGTLENKRLMLGFCNGHLLTDEAGILKNEKQQAQIRHIEFKRDEKMDDELLVQYIQEAIHVRQKLNQQPKHVLQGKSSKPK